MDREFLYRLEDELTRARYEIDEAYQMTQELRLGKDIIQSIGDQRVSITGLKSGAFKAMLEDMKAEIGNLQTQGVADVRAATVEAASEIKATVDNVKSKIKSEVADALQEFSEFTNGGPA